MKAGKESGMDEKYIEMIADKIIKDSGLKESQLFGTEFFWFMQWEYPDMTIRDCGRVQNIIRDKIING